MENNYVNVGEIIPGSKEACEHWNWIKGYMLPILERTYIDAFIHGYKHGKNDDKDC